MKLLKVHPTKIIEKYYNRSTQTYRILMEHSRAVADKALEIASMHHELNPDLQFIEEAALLHDIGIIETYSPKLGCRGEHHYLCHGYLGRQMIEKEGYPLHALVCERHIGVGLTMEDVVQQRLPLPLRNYVPETVEEQIICFADTFFSKDGDLSKEKSVKEVLSSIAKFGQKNIDKFNEWCELFL